MKKAQRPNELREFEAPTIAQLALGVEPVFFHTPVKELLARFQSQQDQPIVPVTDEGGDYAGSVPRRGFLSFMTKAFAMDLYLRRSVGDLLSQESALSSIPVVAQSDERVDQTMRNLLISDPNLELEALPVLENGRFVGLVRVTDMMASLSDSQEKLIDVMQMLSARINEEVTHAALLQRNLLAPSEIQLPGFRGSATLITSTEVGGDYYDYYSVGDRWMVVLIGDVSGHGVAAGTLVSAAKAGINLLSQEGERDPAKILSRLNHAMLNIAHQRLLMTLFAACLDTHTGELTYANAGHQFPYVYRLASGEMEILEVGGLPLGKSADYAYKAAQTRLEVGDRLFLYTDGVIEEENAEAEPFGYDRLEAFLANHFDRDATLLCENLLSMLRRFAGKNQFQDDVTVFCVEHHERSAGAAGEESASHEDLGLVRVAESFYRANTGRLIPRLSRQNLVFLAEGSFGDLMRRFARDGIRRVLPRHQPIIARIGWSKLLAQHQHKSCSDLESFLPNPELAHEFLLRHSTDKDVAMEEAGAWLAESGLVEADRMDTIIMLLDELIENGLYAAPRDGKGRPLYNKGEERTLGKGEILSLSLAIQNGILGLRLQDTWGTLTPAVFLNHLLRHTDGDGLVAGVGGAGIYLLWRLSDYLQYRVHPHHQTQATVLLDLHSPQLTDKDKGFQFLYHGEINEHLDQEPFHADHYAEATC